MFVSYGHLVLMTPTYVSHDEIDHCYYSPRRVIAIGSNRELRFVYKKETRE